MRWGSRVQRTPTQQGPHSVAYSMVPSRSMKLKRMDQPARVRLEKRKPHGLLNRWPERAAEGRALDNPADNTKKSSMALEETPQRR